MSSTDVIASVRNFIAAKSTNDLLDMLRLSDDNVLTIMLIEAIETRHPEIVEQLEAWAMDATTTRSQAEVVLAALA